MSIPNVATLYQRIHKGSEGGGEFSRLMNYLLTAESKAEGSKIEPYSDASGDFIGLDALTESEFKGKEGFIFKFFPSSFSASHKTSIIEAVKSAMIKAPDDLKTIYIVTPEDLLKKDKEWLDNIRKVHEKREYYGEMYGLITGIEHLGHTKITELMLRHPHIGKRYHPELFPYDVELFKLASIDVDDRDFIFDFCFTNDSTLTYLLKRIDLIRMEVWNAITGIPDEYYLKSLGKLEFKIDMNKEVNELILNDPLIFNPASQIRFKIQLLDFIQTSPGNALKVKFRFIFNDNDFFVESRPIELNLV